MRVLIACEYSGAVRDAFIRAGHDARDDARLMSDDGTDSEPGICPACSGSGEGQHEGTTCYQCKGAGEC